MVLTSWEFLFVLYSIVCSKVKFDVKGQVQGHFRQKSTKIVYTNPQLNDFNIFGVLPL